MDVITQKFFLFLSRSKLLNYAARRWGIKFAAGKIVGGHHFEDTVRVIKDLNAKGLCATVDHLGEYVTSKHIADLRTEECINTIKLIHDEQLDSQVSLKLTSLGLDIDQELVYDNLERILQEAKERNVFITIDMEDEQRCQATLDLFKKLRGTYDNLSTVLQAYLYRTDKDLDDLNALNPNLRLVKGAYKEPPEVAFPQKRDVDENFKKMIKKHLLNGNYAAVATHDDAMIDFTKQFVQAHNIPNDQFEFQMLYGMRSKQQQTLADEGYRMRVYVPYGIDWYGYFMRRLAERPANISFVFKGMFKK
jgi:proline dehydrogenase